MPLQTDARACLPRKDFGINGFLGKHNSINLLGGAGARTNQPLNLIKRRLLRKDFGINSFLEKHNSINFWAAPEPGPIRHST
jgi:hypothetical protein